MRVLFSSVSAVGHVHPMIPLARAFLDRGHDLLWATGPDAMPRLAKVAIPARSIGPAWVAIRAEFWGRDPAQMSAVERPDLVFPGLFGRVAAPHTFAELRPLAREWRPDLIVRDAAELAAPLVAAIEGVPCVNHAFGALTPRNRVEAAAEEVAPLWRSAGLAPRPFAGSYDGPYLDIYPATLQTADMSHVPWRLPLRPVPFDRTSDDAPFDLGADDGVPLIYLTLGTIERDRTPLRTAVEAIRDLDVRLLVTVGPTMNPAVLGPQPANVRVESYVPQTEVLDHCAVVVSHAGSGTFLATLAGGIPQLCLPQAADQFLNAEATARSGVGLALQPVEATSAAIAEAVVRLLGDARFRNRAGDLAAEIAAMPGPDEVAASLEDVVAGV